MPLSSAEEGALRQNTDDLLELLGGSLLTRRRLIQGLATALAPAALTKDARSIAAPQQSLTAGPNEGRDLLELTATEAVSLLRSGDLSAEKYAQTLLDQCRKHRALNAFIWQHEDQVLAAARAADKERTAKTPGPLYGLPILI